MSYTTVTTNNIPPQGTVVPYNGEYLIVIHSTGNIDSTASGNANYFNNNWLSAEAFTQAIIDDKQLYRVYPMGQVSWGAGGANGYAYYQLEIAEFADANRSRSAIANAIADIKTVVAQLKAQGKKYRIISHQEATQIFGGNHTDPSGYFARFGYSMDWFRAQVNAGTPSQPTPAPSAPPAGGTQTSQGEEIDMYLIYTVDTKRWYVSNGVDVRYIRTTRMLQNYQDQWGKLTLRKDSMYQSELDKEFGTTATSTSRDVAKCNCNVTTTAPAPTPTPSAPARKTHTVVKGDTLYSISKAYSVTVADIKSWNGLTSDTLTIGVKLYVSK